MNELEPTALNRLMKLTEDWEGNIENYYPEVGRDPEGSQDLLKPGLLACSIIGDFILNRSPHLLDSPSAGIRIKRIIEVATKIERIVGIQAKEYNHQFLLNLKWNRVHEAAQRNGFEFGGDLEHLITEALNELAEEINSHTNSP